MLTIDVVVPTYNRSALLKKTIHSLLEARVPRGLEPRIVVVDNNSVDDTQDIVRQFGGDVVSVRATKQGISSARNAGIAAGRSDVIGFVDDDEEVDAGWFETVHREFQDPLLDFIGGPCVPNWSVPAPIWLPQGYNGAIGWVTAKARAPMDAAFPGNLNGGNAVLRRGVFERVGCYAPQLGRSGKGLLSEEDAEFYRRLMKHNVHGIHVPDLIIFHYVPESRLTRSYHRRWAYWRAVSQGYLDREIAQPVTYLCGVPRHMIGTAARSTFHMPRHLLARGKDGKAFACELTLWDLAGFVYGKHMIKMDRFYGEKGAVPSAQSIFPMRLLKGRDREPTSVLADRSTLAAEVERSA